MCGGTSGRGTGSESPPMLGREFVFCLGLVKSHKKVLRTWVIWPCCFLCFFFMFIYSNVLPSCVSVYHVCVGSPRTGVTGSCELPRRSWELNPGSLEEQPMLLTLEPFSRPHLLSFCFVLGEGLNQGFSVTLEPALELTCRPG